VLLIAMTTPVRALVQTGEPPNLAREGDPIGLTAEVRGFAHPNHGLTAVVTGRAVGYPVKIPEDSPISIRRRGSEDRGERPEEVGVVTGEPTARHKETCGRTDGGVRRPAPNRGRRRGQESRAEPGMEVSAMEKCQNEANLLPVLVVGMLGLATKQVTIAPE